MDHSELILYAPVFFQCESSSVIFSSSDVMMSLAFFSNTKCLKNAGLIAGCSAAREPLQSVFRRRPKARPQKIGICTSSWCYIGHSRWTCVQCRKAKYSEQRARARCSTPFRTLTTREPYVKNCYWMTVTISGLKLWLQFASALTLISRAVPGLIGYT